MKLIVTILAAIVVLWGNCAYAVSNTVVLAVDDWPPFVDFTKEGGGISTEIVTAAFAESGYDVVLQHRPWARARYEVEHGLVAGSFPWILTSNKEEFALFSHSIVKLQESFVYLKSSFPEGLVVDTIDDLRKYSLGGLNGYRSTNYFINEGLEVDVSNNIYSALEKLFAGRFDIVSENKYVVMHVLQEKGYAQEGNVGFQSHDFTGEGGTLMLSRKYPEAEKTMIAFNNGLKKLKASGRYRAILHKHGALEFGRFNEFSK